MAGSARATLVTSGPLLVLVRVSDGSLTPRREGESTTCTLKRDVALRHPSGATRTETLACCPNKAVGQPSRRSTSTAAPTCTRTNVDVQSIDTDDLQKLRGRSVYRIGNASPLHRAGGDVMPSCERGGVRRMTCLHESHRKTDARSTGGTGA